MLTFSLSCVVRVRGWMMLYSCRPLFFMHIESVSRIMAVERRRVRKNCARRPGNDVDACDEEAKVSRQIPFFLPAMTSQYEFFVIFQLKNLLFL